MKRSVKISLEVNIFVSISLYVLIIEEFRHDESENWDQGKTWERSLIFKFVSLSTGCQSYLLPVISRPEIREIVTFRKRDGECHGTAWAYSRTWARFIEVYQDWIIYLIRNYHMFEDFCIEKKNYCNYHNLTINSNHLIKD